MHTCSGWHAAMVAGPPALLPVAVLACPPLEDMGQAEASGLAQAGRLFRKAAGMPAWVLRVRIEGGAQVRRAETLLLDGQCWRWRCQLSIRAALLQPTIVMALLFMLPAGVRELELAVPRCAGPLLPPLARFSRLEELTISGTAAEISWEVGPAAALAPFCTLRLDYRRLVDHGDYFEDMLDTLPASARCALCAATALRSLELRLIWSDEVALLCCALLRLRHLG